MALSLDGFRVTARTLRKQPVFTTVVVLSLALAIAVNTTMYGILDALTHPRLDMRNPSALYWIRFYGDYHWKVDNRARDAALTSGLHGVESVTRTEQQLGRGTLVQHGTSLLEAGVDGVATNYFDVLGPRVLAGRTFVPSDAESAQSPVVIGEDAAASLFPTGASPVGAVIIVNREPRTVIGVVSRASNFPHEGVGVWSIAPYQNRGMYQRLIRLRPGVQQAEAERELAVIAGRIAAEANEDPKSVAFRFHAAADPEFQVRTLHYALMYAVAAVLLVACANLANLQLARGISRRRDLALRSALGATRGRLVAHLLRESVLLAAGGLAAGLMLTWLASRALRAVLPPSMGDFVAEPQLSWRVLAFAMGATLVCLLLAGLAPSLYVSRADPNTLLKSGAGTGASSGNRRQYGVLVAVEIALALALTSGAVLTVRSALQMNVSGVGFDPRPLVTGMMAPVLPPGRRLPYSELLQSMAARVRAIEGVTAASAQSSRGVVGSAVTVEDPGGVREFAAPNYAVTMVSPSIFRTLRLPIVRGRDFLDGERDVGVAIVDEQTARVLWPNANPIGAQIKFGDMKSAIPFVRVVGVVGERADFRPDPNARFLRGVNKLGAIYYLPGAVDTVVTGRGFGATVRVTARTDGSPEHLALTILQSLQAGGDVRTYGIATMDAFLGLRTLRQSTRFVSLLFTLFAAIGVGLAAFGVYGVVAHSVAERRRELGVRIALGATARDILRAVLRESMVVVLLGVAVGLLCTKYGVVLLGNMAIEDDFFNAGLFAAVALALGVTVVVAALVPALRATRVDPTESLRND